MRGSYNKGRDNPFYGKTHSDETRKKMSKARKGEKHWNYGKNTPEKSRKKMSESHIGRFARILSHGVDPNGKKRYALVCDGIRIKTSIDINILKAHPIYNRKIDLSRYKCFDCIYYEVYNKCSVYGRCKFTPQCCVMFNFNQKFWRKLDEEKIMVIY